MIISEKQFLSYIPLEIVQHNRVSFEVKDLNIIVDANTWPSNLTYNPNLIETEDMFYEQFCNDSTLSFYINSAVYRCRSLVSRAVHNPSVIWEHGPIRILEIGCNCPKEWMIRTRVEGSIRKLNK